MVKRKRKLSPEDELKIENSIQRIEAILANQKDLHFLLKDDRICRSLKRLKRSRDIADVLVIQEAMKDRVKQYCADDVQRKSVDITSPIKRNCTKGYFGTVYATHGKKGLYVVTSKASRKTSPKTEIINLSSPAPKKDSPQPVLRPSPAIAKFCEKLWNTENDKLQTNSIQKAASPFLKGRNWLQGHDCSLILPSPRVSNEYSSNPRNFLRFVNGLTNEPPPKFRYITNHVWHSSYPRPRVPKGYMEHCGCILRSHRVAEAKGGKVGFLCKNCDCSDRRGSSDADGFYDVEHPGRLLTTTSIWKESHPSLIVECNANCKCDPKLCSNRVVQKQSSVPDMVVERMEDKGWGVVTLEPIEKGTFVCEYVGEIISESDAERRGIEYDAQGLSYLWTQKTDHAPTIDATRMGNISRFVNHSCDPNLFACEILVESRQMAHIPRIAFFALKRIHIGQELTIDYAYDLSDHPQQIIKCACGSSNCRGRIR